MILNGCDHKICKEVGKNRSRQDHRRSELWGCWVFSETLQPGTWLIEKLGVRKGSHFPLGGCLADGSPLLSLRSWVSCLMLCLCLESLSFNGDCLVFGSHHFSCVPFISPGNKKNINFTYFTIYKASILSIDPKENLTDWKPGQLSHLWLCEAQQVSAPGSRAQSTRHIVGTQKMSVEYINEWKTEWVIVAIIKPGLESSRWHLTGRLL